METTRKHQETKVCYAVLEQNKEFRKALTTERQCYLVDTCKGGCHADRVYYQGQNDRDSDPSRIGATMKLEIPHYLVSEANE